MRRLFEILLWLYPKSFRSEFSREMLVTFEHLQREEGKRGPISAVVFFFREAAGLLRGIWGEQTRVESGIPQKMIAGLFVSSASNPYEIAELERRIRYHLAQTINCIANHRFEGARFHAAEEDRARARLRALEQSSYRSGGGSQL